MKELKCPKCGKVFSVDEASYASIVNQVRTKELEEEIQRRTAEIEKLQQLKQQSDKLIAEQGFQQKLQAKERELEKRNAEIARLEEQVNSIAISKQAEFDKRLSEKEVEIAQIKEKAQGTVKEKQLENERILAEKNTKIARLEEQMKGIAKDKQAEFDKILAEKESELVRLQGVIDQSKSQTQVAVLEEQNKSKDALQKKEQKIAELKNELTANESKSLERVQSLKEMYDMQLKEKQTQIDYYKDLKTRMSTKMVGETLEQHCSTLFNTTIRPLMPNAYFEKDNNIAEGTKGDFIFRDKDNDFEYISIMFEMKNENDTTATKHKNEDFLKKLDDDRRKKGCEYAVLVSLLEPDNETYNTGIVDMSHRYEKMYVIRPQFFIPIITLLVQAAKKSLEYKRQLAIAQSKEIDVTNFEKKLDEFRNLFGNNVKNAHDRFHDAIAAIDKSIADLQKVKDNLLKSDDHLRLANDKVENLTIRKLTYKNPTMKEKFDEARKNNDSIEEITDDAP